MSYFVVVVVVKFIPKHFIHLDAIANKICKNIFFWDCSLLVYRNTVEFGGVLLC